MSVPAFGMSSVNLMQAPRNVFWFEVLLYASLICDALSIAFTTRVDQFATLAAFNGCWIAAQFYCVWLAANQRKKWPRWVLAANLILAGISLPVVLNNDGLQIDNALEVISCALTALGIFLSFTKEANAWFTE